MCPVGLKLTRTDSPPSPPLPPPPSSTPPPGGSARASPLQKTCSARLEAIYHLLEPEITSWTFSPKHNATFNCQVRLKHVSFMRPISATSSPAQPHTPPSLNHDLSPRLVAKTCLRRQPRGLVAATTVVVSRWAPPPGPPRRPDSWHLVAMAVPSEISSSWSTAQSWGHRDEMSARFSADVCGQWGELHHTARPLRVSDPDGAVPERPCSPYAAACALPVLPWRGSVACHPISSEHARIESTPLHAMAATT